MGMDLLLFDWEFAEYFNSQIFQRLNHSVMCLVAFLLSQLEKENNICYHFPLQLICRTPLQVSLGHRPDDLFATSACQKSTKPQSNPHTMWPQNHHQPPPEIPNSLIIIISRGQQIFDRLRLRNEICGRFFISFLGHPSILPFRW